MWVNVESSAIANEKLSGRVLLFPRDRYSSRFRPHSIRLGHFGKQPSSCEPTTHWTIVRCLSRPSGRAVRHHRLDESIARGVSNGLISGKASTKDLPLSCKRNLDRLSALTEKRPEKILSVGARREPVPDHNCAATTGAIPVERLAGSEHFFARGFLSSPRSPVAGTACDGGRDPFSTKSQRKRHIHSRKTGIRSVRTDYQDHYLTQFPSGTIPFEREDFR
jgi:hypothetical protein